MDFIEKQDDNMTIWQFDSITQNITDQIIITHIVKLPKKKKKKMTIRWLSQTGERDAK